MNSPATAPLPPGYTALELERGTAVVLDALATPLASALRAGSFYGYAAAQPAARVLRGRGAAYAVPLPDGVTRVVVRRSRHGGLFAPITGDRFFGRTRAPHELDVALRLAHAGVPTPQLLAYAIYPAGPFTSRADVVTREVPDPADLVATLRWGFEWDVAAAALIGTEAGATVTDAFGQPLVFNTPRAQAFGVIACAPGIHRAVVERLHDRAVALTSQP